MAIANPPTSVAELVSRVTTSTANIDRHRAAMAELKAQAIPPAVPEPKEGVTK